MTLLQAHPLGIPVPNPSPISRPFWEGCRRNELLFQRCANEHAIFNPASLCRLCLNDDLRWEKSEGRGHIYSWSMVWRPQNPKFRVPYSAAIVDLDEGYRMIANVIGCDHADVQVGMRVVAEFHPISSEISLVYFSPVGSYDHDKEKSSRASNK
jgi:uncharacterized OB-fold protein